MLLPIKQALQAGGGSGLSTAAGNIASFFAAAWSLTSGESHQ
jgi:hypothetical protein